MISNSYTSIRSRLPLYAWCSLQSEIESGEGKKGVVDEVCMRKLPTLAAIKVSYNSETTVLHAIYD